MSLAEGIIGIGIAIAVGVIMMTIAGSVIDSANFSGLTATVTGYIIPLFAVALMIIAVTWATGKST